MHRTPMHQDFSHRRKEVVTCATTLVSLEDPDLRKEVTCKQHQVLNDTVYTKYHHGQIHRDRSHLVVVKMEGRRNREAAAHRNGDS